MTTLESPAVVAADGRPTHRAAVRDELSAYARRIGLFDLVRDHGSPLLVLDPAIVTAQLAMLRSELPAAHIHFATKALPHPDVIRAVRQSGASFELASRGELSLLAGLGVDLTRCLHTHPYKTIADIIRARRAGVSTFVVDSVGEVDKFAGIDSGAALLVRLSFPNPEAVSDLSSKFGASVLQAPAIVERAVRHGIRVAGFTFHVGSQTVSAEPYRRAIDATLRLMASMEARHGIRCDTIDIGGGFPVAYDRAVPGLPAIASGIRKALAGMSHLRLVIEPGRFVAAPAMTLVTRVIGSNERVDGPWHYLDDGLYGAYSNIPAEGVHALIFAASELLPDHDESATLSPATLAGPTCDSVDVVARHLLLPRLTVGDLLVSPMMGAYTLATATTFNGIPTTPVHVL